MINNVTYNQQMLLFHLRYNQKTIHILKNTHKMNYYDISQSLFRKKNEITYTCTYWNIYTKIKKN